MMLSETSSSSRVQQRRYHVASAFDSLSDLFGGCIVTFGFLLIVVLLLLLVLCFFGLMATAVWAANGPAQDVCVPAPTRFRHLSFEAFFYVYGLLLPLVVVYMCATYFLDKWCSQNEDLGGMPSCGACLAISGYVAGVLGLFLYAIWVLLAYLMYDGDTNLWSAAVVDSCPSALSVHRVILAIWSSHAIVFGGTTGMLCVAVKTRSSSL